MELSGAVLAAGARIAGILVIGLVAYLVVRAMISRLGKRIVARAPVDAVDAERQRAISRADTITSVFRALAGIAIVTVALLMVLGQVGIELGPLIAGAGIVGVAVGFGAQNLVADFLSGLFMLLDDEYAIGDVVDLGEASGVVESFGLRTTKVRALDGTLWTVRNGQITRTGNMTNRWARAVLDVGVAYDTDLDRARQVILTTAEAVRNDPDHATSFLEPPEVVGVQELGADAIALRLMCKTPAGSQWALARELRGRLKSAFDREGIEFPFPQRTIWIRTESDTLNAPIPLDVTGNSQS